MKRDTVDKIVSSYFAAVTLEPFSYKGCVYEPKPLQVSPLLFRGYTCPARCGGCCPRFSLDYLPKEEHPYSLVSRKIEFNGRMVTVFSDTQGDSSSHHCSNLRMTDGRCSIHDKRPFSCDFELTRFLHYSQTPKALVITKLYGRGHAMLRSDGERGARCEMLPETEESRTDTIRKLERLKDWCVHFKLKTKVPALLKWAKSNPNGAVIL